MTVTGGYVRHRDRMIQESVYDDLKDALIACRWMAGTTSRPVTNPYAADPNAAWGPMTTNSSQVLPLLEEQPVVLIDYFPDAEKTGDVAGGGNANKTAFNTLALDNGTRQDSTRREMGNSSAELVVYTFNMAFFASSDAVAQAVLGDLADRYRGRLIRPDFVELWNYNSTATVPVTRMSVEGFTFHANDDPSIVGNEVHLYFGELTLEDDVD